MCHGLHTKLAGIVSHRARKRNRTFVQLHGESLSVAAPHYFQAWAVANDAPRRASSRGNGNKTESKLASSVLREWITAGRVRPAWLVPGLLSRISRALDRTALQRNASRTTLRINTASSLHRAHLARKRPVGNGCCSA
jgi:hypothetical protein